MIREYIDKIVNNHNLEQAEWMEPIIKDALGPVRWWLIETTNWKWLARYFDVLISVRMVPDGQLITIKKKGEIIAQREFDRNNKEVIS